MGVYKTVLPDRSLGALGLKLSLLGLADESVQSGTLSANGLAGWSEEWRDTGECV